MSPPNNLVSLTEAEHGNVLRTDRGRWFEIKRIAKTRLHALPLQVDKESPDWFSTTSLRRHQFSTLGKRIGSEEYAVQIFEDRHDAARWLIRNERDTAAAAYGVEQEKVEWKSRV